MTVREEIHEILKQALAAEYPAQAGLKFDVYQPREKTHGDFATNAAIVVGKALKSDPMAVARRLAERAGDRSGGASGVVESAEVAKPGFINLKMARQTYLKKLREIMASDEESCGACNVGQGTLAQVEFVSANPTGPLNVVSARAAAVGDALVRLLRRTGYEARSEFYVNDAGTQVHLLGLSLEARFRELLGERAEIPEGGYPGDYLVPIAEQVKRLADWADSRTGGRGDALGGGETRVESEEAQAQAGREGKTLATFLCRETDSGEGGPPLKAGLPAAKVFLGGVPGWRFDFGRFAVEAIVEGQRRSLEGFGKGAGGGLKFDAWVRESSLRDTLGEVAERLGADGRYVCEEDGALWLRDISAEASGEGSGEASEKAAKAEGERGGKAAEDRSEEKDQWVIRRRTGEPTYFLADIAYHVDKLRRGFKRVIDIWGPDHHGHVARMKAAMRIAAEVMPELQAPEEWLEILIAQQVNLVRAGKRVQMSKRAGEYVTLDDVVSEVGADAARFFFLMRRTNSHLDFDLDLAKKASDENPVFYVQYANARISSIAKVAAEAGLIAPGGEVVGTAAGAGATGGAMAAADLTLLATEEEIDLIKGLADFDEVVKASAFALEPHRIIAYLMDLAARFHRFYHKHRVVADDRALSTSRLALCLATRTVLRSALSLVGVSAPASM
ncbi:MAG: arginine--tRNA ligase [bacterium]